MKCECKAIVKVNTPGLAKIISNSLKVVQVNSDEEVNLAYVKQMDLFDSIFGIRKISEKDYSNQEMQRLEKILINLTQGG